MSRARRVANLLLPERDEVDRQGDDRGALDDLDEPQLAEMGEKQAEHHGAGHHADQQHHAEKGHDAGTRPFGRQIRRQGKTDGLDGVQAGSNEQDDAMKKLNDLFK